MIDAYSDEPRRCLGYDTLLLGYNVSQNNRALSCIGTVAPFFPAGKLVKIANKSDEAHYVVKSTVRNGDTLVELAPAQKSLTYLNEIVYTTTQGRKLTKSWFAKYKLPDGDLNHGYNHILYRHSPNSSATLLNPSKAKSIGRFSSDSDIKPLIESALTDKLSTAQIRNIEKGGIEVIVDFERQIGFQYNNPKTNNIIPLDRLLIVLDDTGSIITAYPIKK